MDLSALSRPSSTPPPPYILPPPCTFRHTTTCNLSIFLLFRACALCLSLSSSLPRVHFLLQLSVFAALLPRYQSTVSVVCLTLQRRVFPGCHRIASTSLRAGAAPQGTQVHTSHIIISCPHRVRPTHDFLTQTCFPIFLDSRSPLILPLPFSQPTALPKGSRMR